MNQNLRGLIAPVVTPFDSDGNIDEKLFADEVDYLSDTGVHGLSPGGSTGEGAFLQTEEIARLVGLIRKNNRNKLPIVAGIIRNSTKDAVEAGLAARDAGADALMITPTSYNVLVPDEAGNYEFYKTISDRVGLPIVIYNVVPQNEISTDLFIRLLDDRYVVGIKQSMNGVRNLYDKILRMNVDGLAYAAADDMLFSCFELGASGAIAAILTLFPEACRQMWDYAEVGNHREGMALQSKLYPVWQKIIGPHFPRRIKTALGILGRKPGLTRSPITPTTEREFQVLQEALETIAHTV